MFPVLPGQQRQRYPRSARLTHETRDTTVTLISHSVRSSLSLCLLVCSVLVRELNRAVGQQMGGAASLMYVIGCRLHNKPHYVNKMLLLSPAGIHRKVPCCTCCTCLSVPV
jgi:hypothetical protein